MLRERRNKRNPIEKHVRTILSIFSLGPGTAAAGCEFTVCYCAVCSGELRLFTYVGGGGNDGGGGGGSDGEHGAVNLRHFMSNTTQYFASTLYSAASRFYHASCMT